jgi:hypothetical protein
VFSRLVAPSLWSREVGIGHFDASWSRLFADWWAGVVLGPRAPCGPCIASGVGHIATASSKRLLCWVTFSRSGCSAPSPERIVGHCEDEQPLAFLARADLLRREKSRLNREAKSGKLSVNDVEAEAEMAGDVLEEDEIGAGLDGDPPDVRPEVARIVAAAPPAGGGEGLAGIAGSEAMNAATPRAAVEGSGIAPQRSRSQEARLHRCDQVRAGECVSLHVTDDASARDRQSDSEIQPASAGAEGEDAEVGGR